MARWRFPHLERVLGPLSKTLRVSRSACGGFFPEHWDGVGNDYLMSHHVADVIGFLEKFDAGPVDLMGHSRGGHIAFRVAGERPICCAGSSWRTGGKLDASLDANADPAASPRGACLWPPPKKSPPATSMAG